MIKYDGKIFTKYSTKEGLIDNEIWAIEIDKVGAIWVGSVGGASKFNGINFETFVVPKAEVSDAESMHFFTNALKSGDLSAINQSNQPFRVVEVDPSLVLKDGKSKGDVFLSLESLFIDKLINVK